MKICLELHKKEIIIWKCYNFNFGRICGSCLMTQSAFTIMIFSFSESLTIFLTIQWATLNWFIMSENAHVVA